MNSARNTINDPKVKESKDEVKKDEKLKRSVYTVSTPRTIVQKSAADIYSRQNSFVKAPKKAQGTSRTKESPMKDVLKSSPKVKDSSKAIVSARTSSKSLKSTSRTSLPFSNVTPSSVKLTSSSVKLTSKIRERDAQAKVAARSSPPKPRNVQKFVEKPNEETINVEKSEKVIRQRTKTRTLEDDEVKVLTPDVVDNNAEMLNLTKKLSAQPKAFYVDLDVIQRKEERRGI
ncbi:uncharacterized protein LOC126973380 isoform X2 [Leptidea sinapis]|uniref:uncharacterized protein LOC126973380 isoform X2 n=1 Tax=Leptidea sinapis TaxID=189913 RepID=UPI0021C46D56|nr:uncharacterized protein LOC126973380 isoform X2 [Leptidea sinapis]